jgi:hypothetical protein
MSEILDYEQIKQRYDGQWVIIAYREIDEDLEVLAGEVLAHSSSETEIYQMLSLASGINVSIEYIGAIPENIIFMSDVQRLSHQKQEQIADVLIQELYAQPPVDDITDDEIMAEVKAVRQQLQRDGSSSGYLNPRLSK